MLLNIETFFGRFHPLLVHLPIGFLLLGVVFYLLSAGKKYSYLYAAVPVSLLVGSISAAFACITGYVLSLSGSYNEAALNSHLRLGLITTLVSFLAYFISVKRVPLAFFRSTKVLALLVLALFVLVNITGHLGGTLTHGDDYISTAVLLRKKKPQKKLTDINDAAVYAHLVKPVLEEKCAGCHNDANKSGGLSVASYEAILQGGKHGPGVAPGNLAGSEIIKRISLLPSHKKFMPANGRRPLTWQETELLRWWTEKAAGKNEMKLSEVAAPGPIREYAAAYLGLEQKNAAAQYPTVNINAPAVPKQVVERLKGLGFSIKYIHYQPDLLDVTLPPSNSGNNVSVLLGSLLKVKDNIVWLNVAGTKVSDNDMEMINQFRNLERLRLDANPVTDKGMSKLTGLSRLQSLNVNETDITKDGLASFGKLASLRRVYAVNTGIKKEDAESNKTAFTIVTGVLE